MIHAPVHFSPTCWPSPVGPLLVGGLLYTRRVRTLAGRSSIGSAHPVPGWRQACFYAGFVTIGAALTSLGETSQELLFAHMIEHLLLGEVAALLIVLGLTGPLIAPILRIGFLRAHAGAATPAGRLPAVGSRPVHMAPARALRSGAAQSLGARPGAHHVPRLRDQHVDVPVRAAADACLVREPRQARLHRRRPPHGHRAGQRLPVVGGRLLHLLCAQRLPAPHLPGRRPNLAGAV